MARLSCFLGALLLPLLAAGIQLEFSINSQNGVLPNPSKLPSSTNAVLSSLGPPLVAPITASNTFLFSSVPVGSYLLSVYSRDAVFEDLRVDVIKNDTGESASSWTTFRGNEWDNKGELRGSGEGSSVQIEVRPLVSKDYYQERSTCRLHTRVALDIANHSSLHHFNVHEPHDLNSNIQSGDGGWDALLDG